MRTTNNIIAWQHQRYDEKKIAHVQLRTSIWRIKEVLPQRLVCHPIPLFLGPVLRPKLKLPDESEAIAPTDIFVKAAIQQEERPKHLVVTISSQTLQKHEL